MRKGFTLLELILVLVIVGAVAAAGGLGLFNFVQGFIFARDNADLAQKAETAMMRMRIELSRIEHDTANEDVEISDSSTSTSLSYTAMISGGSESHVISLSGDELRLDGIPLADNVDSLQFAYLDESGSTASSPSKASSIRITLQMTGVNEVQKTFTSQVSIFAKKYENG